MSILNLFKLGKKQYPGKLILILGPSGTGKGTVIGKLKQTFPELVFPASYTTRDKRPNEVEGEVYHFISKAEFQQKIKANEFLEWALVHDINYYGTAKTEIINALKAGQTVLREVDIQGVESLKKIIDEKNIYTIFITTDSWKKLENRIRSRANILEEELLNRKKSYLKEIKYLDKVSYVLYSEDGKIEECNQRAIEIVKEILAS